MYIWLFSFCLALICCTGSVQSQSCRDHCCKQGEFCNSEGQCVRDKDASISPVAFLVAFCIFIIAGLMTCCFRKYCCAPPSEQTQWGTGAIPRQSRPLDCDSTSNEMRGTSFRCLDEVQSESVAADVSRIEVETDSPLPPDGPPPYNSLGTEGEQNCQNDLPEYLLPSYEEVVRHSSMTT